MDTSNISPNDEDGKDQRAQTSFCTSTAGDATSVIDQSDQEQTNSCPQSIAGINAESDAALKKEQQNVDSEKEDKAGDATSVIDQSDQEQTNSCPQTTAGIIAESDADLKKEGLDVDSGKEDKVSDQSDQEQTNNWPQSTAGINSESDAALKKEGPNVDSEKEDKAGDATSVIDQSDQEQTNSCPQTTAGINSESDAALKKEGPNVDSEKEDQDQKQEQQNVGDGKEDTVYLLTSRTLLSTQRPSSLLDGPTPVQREEPTSTTTTMILAVLVIAVIGGLFFNGSSTQPDQREYSSVDIFRREFDKMKSSFPSQGAELWKRSRIHLERHLQTAEPTEPVSMILTSGRGAERTLSCLASRMAAAFSSALGASGASVLHIDGAAAATSESDQVKLDIDRRLIGAFEDDGKAAVVHRLEELPPASALIFYRYCDHENAAFKKALLIFTVLLEEDEIQSHLGLSAVEEMVQDHIQYKFLSSTQPSSYDKMDMDKLSGLWSRISHLTLPVAEEGSIEMNGCDI